VNGAQQPAASISPWASRDDALAVRTATFATPIVVLGADVGQQQLVQLCRLSALQLRVHDRTALPEPAPFTAARMERQRQQQIQQQQQQQQHNQQAASVKAGTRNSTAKQPAAKAASLKAAQRPPSATPAPSTAMAAGSALASDVSSTALGAAAAASDAAAAVVVDDGEVYGAAAVSLVDLAKGGTSSCFTLPLRPVSTIRGSCLDWKSRPGRYLEVCGSAACGSM